MSKECLGHDCIYWNFATESCTFGPDQVEHLKSSCPLEDKELSDLTKDKVLNLLRGYLLENQEESFRRSFESGPDAPSVDWCLGAQCALESAIMLVSMMEV